MQQRDYLPPELPIKLALGELASTFRKKRSEPQR